MKFPSMARAKAFQTAGAGVSGIGELIFQLAKQRADEQRQLSAIANDTRRLDQADAALGFDREQQAFQERKYDEEPGRLSTELDLRRQNDLDLENLRSKNDLDLEKLRTSNDLMQQRDQQLDSDLEGIAAGMWVGKQGSLGSTGAWSAMRGLAPKASPGRLLGAAGRAKQKYTLDISGPPSRQNAPQQGATKATINKEQLEQLKRAYIRQFGLSEGEAQNRILEKYIVK